MLTPFEKLRGCILAASDGGIGEVREFYFDDEEWRVRYLVVATGSWLSGRDVLIAPDAVRDADAQSGTIAVNLTQEQVRESPPLELDKPVSRQHEEELHRHYDWRPYWVVPSAAGLGAYAPALFAQQQALVEPPGSEPSQPKGDPHLRSSGEVVKRYSFEAQDGEIGTVDDFILDSTNWRIRYVVVRTGMWFFGQRVLLAPEWIERISYERSQLLVNLPRSAIKTAPAYDSSSPISRTYEQRLHDHYGRKRDCDAVEAAP